MSRVSEASADSVDQRHALAALGHSALSLGVSVQQAVLIALVLCDGVFNTSNVQPGHDYSKKLQMEKKSVGHSST